MLTLEKLPLESERCPAGLSRHQVYVDSHRLICYPMLILRLAAVERAGIKPELVQEVFMGNVLSAK